MHTESVMRESNDLEHENGECRNESEELENFKNTRGFCELYPQGGLSPLSPENTCANQLARVCRIREAKRKVERQPKLKVESAKRGTDPKVETPLV